MLHLGDCEVVLKTLPDNSVDALVTDPPAGIAFMGKDWDKDKGGRKEWCAWMEAVMRECIRVLKPGAHGLVWALPRTAHWTATALEDAGFEIRDCITHLFGQGFPKSLNISKAIDKAAGAERETIGEGPFASRRPREDHSKQGLTYADDAYVRPAGHNLTAPATDAAKQWDGWGTALKPAAEFWWLVRKPCSEKTVAGNVLKLGTGGINIDGCRIEAKDDRSARYNGKPPGGTTAAFQMTDKKETPWNPTQGRFPANLVFSHSPNCTEDACDMFECAVEMLDEQSGYLHGAGNKEPRIAGVGNKSDSVTKAFGAENGPPTMIYDRGGKASRFFYCAKVSPAERGESSHPTMKTQKLMRYLCRLITPAGGTVLDPFMGSGSTGLAAKSEGFEFIGIEREAEYFEIARTRLNQKTP